MKLINILLALSFSLSGQSVVTGLIYGNKAPVAGSIVSISVIPDAPPAITKSYFAITKTDASGRYLLGNVPAGNYRLCAQLENSRWVNPCEWEIPSVLQVRDKTTVDAGTMNLEGGYLLTVVLDDAQGHIDKNRGRTYGAEIGLIATAGASSKPLSATPTKNGLEYTGVLPLEKNIELHVVTNFYQLVDPEKKSADRGNATVKPLFFAKGEKEKPLTLQVTALKPGK